MKLAPVCVDMCLCMSEICKNWENQGQAKVYVMIQFNMKWAFYVIAVENSYLNAMWHHSVLLTLTAHLNDVHCFLHFFYHHLFTRLPNLCLQFTSLLSFRSYNSSAHWKHSTQTACISYFRTAVSEHHDQGSLSNKHLIWRLMVLRVHDHHKGEYGSRQAGVLMEL